MQLREDTFAALVGARFTARPSLGGETLELVLSACAHSPYAAPGGEAFSLTFHGPAHHEQQIFTLAHGDETVELFLVPVGPEPEGMAYEAVINTTAAAP